MRGLTRRAFLRRSAVTAGLAGTLRIPATALAATGRVSKCVAMAPINHGGDVEDLRVNGNLEKVLALGADWVRLWIRWDKAQLYPPEFVPFAELEGPLNDAPGCGAGCGFRYLQAIDDQIARARAAGLRVILTAWQFPRWANGTAAGPPDRARPDRGGRGERLSGLKPLEQGIPVEQLDADGHYGRWLGFLIDRYRGYGRDLVLEVMNEPNHQMWPQQGPARNGDPYGPGEPLIAEYVADMMVTAQVVSARHGHPIGLAGPALADRTGPDGRLLTSFRSTVAAVLAALERRGFPDSPGFVWTHHNYSDIERDLSSPTRAEEALGLLRGRWPGRGGRGDPRLWLTEGGARLGSRGVTDPGRQARLLTASGNRSAATTGIELFSNYPMYANPYADSGLLDAAGAPRPAWSAFRRL